MRLTLRTLLAFLDDILDETDAQELQRKIDESEKATQLVHRIRQIVGQTRLDSPPLDADGFGDANSVSEYLDNTLPVDDVPEFERSCLDADVQLGEVAACHQILTLVLGESAVVTSRLRNRAYQLGTLDLDRQGATIEKAVEGETAGIDVPAATSEGVESDPIEPLAAAEPVTPASYDSDEHWTTAPDYLRRPRRALWKPVGIAAMIAFCFVLAGIRGMGPLDQSHPIAAWFRGDELAQAPISDEETEEPEVVIPTAPSDADEILAGPANAVETTTQADDGAREPMAPSTLRDELVGSDDLTIGSASEPADEVVESLPLDAPDATGLPDEATVIQEPRTAVDPTDGLRGDIPIEVPENGASAIDEGPATATTDLDAPVDNGGQLVPPEPGDLGIINLGPRLVDAARPEPNPGGLEDGVDDGATDVAEPREVGKFLSEDQLLVRYNSLSELWERTSARGSIREDEQLLSFPVFRPQLMLATGMQLTLVGPAKLRLLPLGADDSPNVQMEFGRATIETFAQEGSTIGIQWASQSATATLADTNSSFAIDLSRQFVPGTDIENADAHLVLHVYTKSGSVDWQVGDDEPITVAAGQRLTIVDESDGRLVAVEELPAWIDGSDGRPRDPEAVRYLLPQITVDRPISLSLKEQADSRRLEVRSLAVCSLAFLGEFDPLLVALNDNRMKSYWTDEYRALTQAITASPAAAKQMRTALESKHGAEGRDLFRLLWGFDSDQLRDGGALKLITYLDHPSSDFRIVAHENLKAITGTPSLYMPHYGEKMRKAHVFKWKDKLSKGQIVYREPPAISVLLDAAPTEE